MLFPSWEKSAYVLFSPVSLSTQSVCSKPFAYSPVPHLRSGQHFFFCKFNCRRLLRGCWHSRPTWALWTPLSPARPYLMMHYAASDKEEQVKQENHRSSVTFLLSFSYTSASPRTLLNRLKPESKSCLWFSCIFLENLWFKTFRRNDLRYSSHIEFCKAK